MWCCAPSSINSNNDCARSIHVFILFRDQSEAQRLDYEALIDRQNESMQALQQRIDEFAVISEENARLKDQLDEQRHANDKLQKAEAIIDKLKKKLEESSDTRRQSKAC